MTVVSTKGRHGRPLTPAAFRHQCPDDMRPVCLFVSFIGREAAANVQQSNALCVFRPGLVCRVTDLYELFMRPIHAFMSVVR